MQRTFKLVAAALVALLAASNVHATTVCNITDFGSVADGHTDNSAAFANAFACVVQQNGSAATLLIPDVPGSFQVNSTVTLYGASNWTLQVDGTITLPASPSNWHSNSQSAINVGKGNNIVVQSGPHGQWNGQGQLWWQLYNNATITYRPYMLGFTQITNLLVQNITMINPPMFFMAGTYLTNFEERFVNKTAFSSVVAEPPNTDGLDLEYSTNVHIHDGYVNNGDDFVALKTNVTNLVYENMQLYNGHGTSIGSLGSGNSSGYASNCTFRNLHMTNAQQGARIKLYQGGTGLVTGITFTNYTLVNVQTGIYITSYYCSYTKPSGSVTQGESLTLCTPYPQNIQVSNVTFSNIVGTYTSQAVHLLCSASNPCEGITMSGNKLTLAAGGKAVASQCVDVVSYNSTCSQVA